MLKQLHQCYIQKVWTQRVPGFSDFYRRNKQRKFCPTLLTVRKLVQKILRMWLLQEPLTVEV